MCLAPSTIGKVITCKAAVAWAPKQPLVIEEIQVDPPKPTEVRIKITHTSLCHTDLTYWEAEEPHLFPRIFGHEAAGIVESVGDEVLDIKPGDYVIPCFSGECKECKYCKYPNTNICTRYTVDPLRGHMLASGTRFSIHGRPIHHFMGTSTFSEYTVVDQGQVAKVNPNAPLDRVCLLGCGVSTGMGAALKTAKVQRGSSVAIFGLGAVGLAVAAGAKMAGAERIIGVDLNPSKFIKAKAFGVGEFVNPSDHNKPLHQIIQEMTDGGVDYSFECVGNVKVMRSAFDSCQPGWGKCIVVGVDGENRCLEINPVEFFSGRTWTGSVFGGYKCRSDLPALVDMYMNKELSYDEIVTHELPFSKINKAFELLQAGKSLRSVLTMDA